MFFVWTWRQRESERMAGDFSSGLYYVNVDTSENETSFFIEFPCYQSRSWLQTSSWNMRLGLVGLLNVLGPKFYISPQDQLTLFCKIYVKCLRFEAWTLLLLSSWPWILLIIYCLIQPYPSMYHDSFFSQRIFSVHTKQFNIYIILFVKTPRAWMRENSIKSTVVRLFLISKQRWIWSETHL